MIRSLAVLIGVGAVAGCDRPEWLDVLDWQPDRDDPHCGSGYSAELDFVVPSPGVPDAG